LVSDSVKGCPFFVLSIPSDRLFYMHDTSLERRLNADTENAIGQEKIWRSGSERRFWLIGK